MTTSHGIKTCGSIYLFTMIIHCDFINVAGPKGQPDIYCSGDNLRKCWPLALQHVPLLANSDIVVYLNPSRTEIIPVAMDLLSQTFANQNLTVHTRKHASYQTGAIQAVTDAAMEGWFENYDWIFRHLDISTFRYFNI